MRCIFHSFRKQPRPTTGHRVIYTRKSLRVHTRRQTLSMSKNCNVITGRGRARLNRYALPRKQWIGRFPVTLNCQHICQLLLRLRGHYVCLFIIIPRRRLHIHISRDRSMLEDFTFTERFSEWPSLIILLEWLWMKGWSQSTVVSCWQDSIYGQFFFVSRSFDRAVRHDFLDCLSEWLWLQPCAKNCRSWNLVTVTRACSWKENNCQGAHNICSHWFLWPQTTRRSLKTFNSVNYIFFWIRIYYAVPERSPRRTKTNVRIKMLLNKTILNVRMMCRGAHRCDIQS